MYRISFYILSLFCLAWLFGGLSILLNTILKIEYGFYILIIPFNFIIMPISRRFAKKILGE